MWPLAVFSLFLTTALWAGVTEDLDAIRGTAQAYVGCMRGRNPNNCVHLLSQIQRDYDRALLRVKAELEESRGDQIPAALKNAENFQNGLESMFREFREVVITERMHSGNAPFSAIEGSLKARSDHFRQIFLKLVEEKTAEASQKKPPAPETETDKKGRAIVRGQEREQALEETGGAEPEDYQLAGRDFMDGGSPSDAERVLTKALAQKKDDPETLSLRSLARSQSGNLRGALEDAETALKSDPDNKLAGEVAAFSKAGLRTQPFKEVRKPALGAGWEAAAMTERPGGSSPPRPGIGRPAGTEAGEAVETQSEEAAGPSPERAGNSPAAPAGVPAGRQDSLTLARRKLEIGDFQGALLDATRAADARPSEPAAWVLRARISNRLKNPAGALADADKALALAPNDAGALRERAYALYELGRHEEAYTAADRAVGLEPANATGYLYRAMIEEKLNRKQEAMTDFEKAAVLDPALRPLAEEAARRMGFTLKPAAPAASTRQALWTVRLLAVPVAAGLILLGLNALWRRATRGPAPAPEAAAPPGTLPAGVVLGGNFRVERELGRGGMGVVYEATDLALNRRVALKQVRVQGGGRDGVLNEARMVAQLKHPNLVPIFSIIEDQGLYLVLELVEGETLDAVLGRRGPLGVEEIRRVLAGVAAAVDYAHSRRIIHRDLKPANVILTKGGEVMVTDFGIAHEASGVSKTTSVEVWGTPHYMAPEQLLGRVSPSTDLYALGVMAYELTTGKMPFAPGDLAAKTSGRFEPASSLQSGLPGGLDAFFKRVLSPRPEDRPADARQLLAEFDAAAGRT